MDWAEAVYRRCDLAWKEDVAMRGCWVLGTVRCRAGSFYCSVAGFPHLLLLEEEQKVRLHILSACFFSLSVPFFLYLFLNFLPVLLNFPRISFLLLSSSLILRLSHCPSFLFSSYFSFLATFKHFFWFNKCSFLGAGLPGPLGTDNISLVLLVLVLLLLRLCFVC